MMSLPFTMITSYKQQYLGYRPRYIEVFHQFRTIMTLAVSSDSCGPLDEIKRLFSINLFLNL